MKTPRVIVACMALAMSAAFAQSRNFEGLSLGSNFSLGSRSTGPAAGLGAEMAARNRTSFELIPGFALSDSLQVYGKVSVQSNAAQNDSAVPSYSLSGLGYGVGLRSRVDKNLYLQAGYDWYQLGDTAETAPGATLAPRSSIFSLGFGYKF